MIRADWQSVRRQFALSGALLCFLIAGMSAWWGWRGLAALEPLLLIRSSPVDLGSIEQDSSYPVGFVLVNRGTRPLEILAIESSCSCTAAELNKSFIEAGTSSTIRTTLSTGAVAGPLSTALIVSYREAGSSAVFRARLAIAGVVVEKSPESTDILTLFP